MHQTVTKTLSYLTLCLHPPMFCPVCLLFSVQLEALDITVDNAYFICLSLMRTIIAAHYINEALCECY